MGRGCREHTVGGGLAQGHSGGRTRRKGVRWGWSRGGGFRGKSSCGGCVGRQRRPIGSGGGSCPSCPPEVGSCHWRATAPRADTRIPCSGWRVKGGGSPRGRTPGRYRRHRCHLPSPAQPSRKSRGRGRGSREDKAPHLLLGGTCSPMSPFKHSHACTLTRMHTHVHVRVHTGTCAHTSHIHAHSRASTCTCSLTCMLVHVHVLIYTCTPTQVHIHAHTHTTGQQPGQPALSPPVLTGRGGWWAWALSCGAPSPTGQSSSITGGSPLASGVGGRGGRQ